VTAYLGGPTVRRYIGLWMAGNALDADPSLDDELIRRRVEPLLGRSLSAASRADLATYLAELRSWGARLDLVAPRTKEEFLDLAIWDAAIVAREEASAGSVEDRLVDVGSGGGAPGIPLAIFLAALRGSCSLTLVEPRAKRVTFLRTVSAKLTTVRLDVVRGRSEDLPTAGFDVAISRATLAPDAWLREGSRLATKAVWVLLARGEAPAGAAWSAARDIDYEWPLGGHRRRALRYSQA
jgi:16S rRNA (guanine527-N7)-methyltransferase